MATRFSIPVGSQVLDPLLPWIADWLEGRESTAPACEVEILKHSALRLVLRLPHPDRGRIILKLYRRKGMLEALRSLWLRSRSLVEQRVLDLAKARAIPCPTALDAGHSGGLLPRLGWLILEDLGEGQDLDRIHRTQGLSDADLEACAALLSQALQKGLRHRDLHLGNFFRKPDGRLFLLDLHSASFTNHPTSRAQSTSSFRPLYLSFVWPEQRYQRRILFPLLGLPADPPQLPSWRIQWLTRRLARCLRDSGSFYWRDSIGQGRATSFTPTEILEATESARVIKEGRRGSVRQSPLGIHKVRRSGHSLQLWLASEALSLRGIPHPRALAWMPLSSGRGVILCQDLGTSRHLDAASDEETAALALDLGRSFGRMHGTGWRFRDARGDNFLLSDGRVHFVDLDGCSPLPGLRGPGACAADLGRLLAWLQHQSPERLRGQALGLGRIFLRSYLRERRALDGEPGSLHSFCRQIALRSQAWRKSHH